MNTIDPIDKEMKDELIYKISRLIIAARKAKGWSQADLAKACGKSRQSMTNWEKGKVNPGIYVLYEMAMAMDIPLRALTDIDALTTDTSAEDNTDR